MIYYTGDDEATAIDVENYVDVGSDVFSLEICKPEAETETRQQKRIYKNIQDESTITDIIKVTTIDFVSHVIHCLCILNVLLSIKNEPIFVKVVLSICFGYFIKTFSGIYVLFFRILPSWRLWEHY